jgi:hypothetical protein
MTAGTVPGLYSPRSQTEFGNEENKAFIQSVFHRCSSVAQNSGCGYLTKEGRLPFRKRPPSVDGDKPNSVVDDHLSRAACAACPARTSAGCDYYPGETGRRPISLFCLAPHGVFRAPELARRAVGFYPAVSPLPRFAPGRFVFCDTFRRPQLSPRVPACFTRHVALWCSDFPLPRRTDRGSDHLPSARNVTRRAARGRGKFSGCAGRALRLPAATPFMRSF